jgi:hypothetical protein
VTQSFRTRLIAAVSVFALLTAGAMLTAQAFTADLPAGAAVAPVSDLARADEAAAITMTDWSETNVPGSVVRPPIIRRANSFAPLMFTPPQTGATPPRTPPVAPPSRAAVARPPVVRR